MAIVIDPNESRDRRLKMLLDTATSAMQIQNQKQQLAQQQQQMMMENQQKQAQMQMDAGRYLGMRSVPSPDMARMANENQMQANPNRGSMMQIGGQSFVPDSRLTELTKSKGYSGTPRFMQDDDGNIVPLPGILVETPQQKMDRKASAPTADAKNALMANQNAYVLFNQLKDMSSNLKNIGGWGGIAIKGGNVLTRGKLNPEAKAYADFMPAAGVSVYRGITGDTRLSDADAASRAYPLMWDIGEDGSVKGLKEGAVDNMLKARNILLSNNIYTTKQQDKITSLEDVTFVSNAVAKGVPEDKIISFLKSKRKK